MDAKIKTILISAGTFIGVFLVMCLVAKIMMQDPEQQSSAYEQAINKLSGETDAKNGAAADDKAGTEENVSSQNDSSDGNKGTVSDDKSDNATGEKNSSTGDVSDSQNSEGIPNSNSDGAIGTGDGGTAEQTPTSAPSSKHKVVINAAHQSKYDNDTEPIGPGASKTRIKAITGATGVSSGVPEYKVNLAIAKLLRDELVSRGYEVYMIRESDDVNSSDATRAKLANENGDIVLHIHCNADEAEGIKGIMAFYPSKDNEYAGKYSDSCKNLCNWVLKGLEAATQDKNWGPIALDTQTALNWTTIPAAHVEVGYLSNNEEDELLQTESYRKKIATGIADGIDLYFSNN